MSATTSRRNRHADAPAADTANQESNSTMDSNTPASATETSVAALNTATDRAVTVEIAGLQVTLPLKFAAGHVLTENQAKILDAAYQRQFTNNQNAIAKGKADGLAKLPADASDADRAKYAPDSADVIASRFADYEPNVGGGPRMGSMERMRMDAAWRAWVKLVTEHNESVKAGGEPVITKAGNKPVVIASAPRKTDKVDVLDSNGNVTGKRDATEAEHTARVDAFNAARDSLKARILTLPAYADRVQAELDAIMAEKGANKSDAPAAESVTASDDLLG